MDGNSSLGALAAGVSGIENGISDIPFLWAKRMIIENGRQHGGSSCDRIA
jgi:hypothetical protein